MTPEQVRNFDKVFEEAVQGSPQTISRDGKPVAVLVDYEYWQELMTLAIQEGMS